MTLPQLAVAYLLVAVAAGLFIWCLLTVSKDADRQAKACLARERTSALVSPAQVERSGDA